MLAPVKSVVRAAAPHGAFHSSPSPSMLSRLFSIGNKISVLLEYWSNGVEQCVRELKTLKRLRLSSKNFHQYSSKYSKSVLEAGVWNTHNLVLLNIRSTSTLHVPVHLTRVWKNYTAVRQIRYLRLPVGEKVYRDYGGRYFSNK